MPGTDNPDRVLETNHRGRTAAVLEVIAAFVFVHILFRAIKHFTVWGRIEGSAGLNFTPGVVMILFTVTLLLVCRRSLAAYGFTLAGWPEGLRLGLLWGVLLVSGGAALRGLGVRHKPGGPPPTMAEGLLYGGAALLAVAIFAWVMQRGREASRRGPPALWVALLLGLLCVPLVVAICCGRPFVRTMLTVSWLVIGAGCGEEAFYRGYVQSRLNAVFSRPFQVFRLRFGFGLLVSSLLFGFLHALNSVDYFQGRFTFAWGFGVATIPVGLLYGCLRESTGSVLAGTVTHAVLDVLVIVPGLITGT